MPICGGLEISAAMVHAVCTPKPKGNFSRMGCTVPATDAALLPKTGGDSEEELPRMGKGEGFRGCHMRPRV